MKASIKILLFIICCHFFSCDKQNEWLEKKSNKSDVILSSAKDYQAILDNINTFNELLPGFGILCTDNITADAALWAQGQPDERNAYIFADIIFEDQTWAPLTWSRPYAQIAHCNIVVEGIQKIKSNIPSGEYNNIMGTALFFRSLSYFNLVQEFTVPYNVSISKKELGIPIRLTTDVNENSVRPNLQANFDYIITDLKMAEELLTNLPAYQTRPSKFSTCALLARLYLTMGRYDEALKYAVKALDIYNYLIDYNSLSATAPFPFPTYPNNKEIVFYAKNMVYWPLNYHPNYGRVNPELYDMYKVGDLRKTIFYNKNNLGHILFKGQYSGEAQTFAGFATNEMYLIKAECQARLNNYEPAMKTLNELLVKRHTITFVPPIADNSESALTIILEERRKELPFLSNMRFQDLRRLNQEPLFAKRVVHTLDGVNYILEPNDSKYVFDIPIYEINQSGIEQNSR